MSKILTVFGATGNQGGSLINYVVNSSKLSKIYKLRGVTRDVSKPAALALKEKGVEVVKGDMDDRGSLDKAVAGSYAVFAVTNFWEKVSADIEIAQGKAMADAAVAAGATLLIWCSLPNVTKMSEGKLTKAHHFDSKAAVETYIRGLPIKSAFFMAGFFMQNMQTMFKPKPNAAGVLELEAAWNIDTPLPMIDITDTGKYVAPILLDPEKYNGKIFTSATAYYSSQQLLDTWKEVTGRKVNFVKTSGEKMTSLPPELQNMMKDLAGLATDYSLFGPTGPKGLEWTLAQMEEAPTSLEGFVRANEPWFGED
ncbi:hypothetical protein MMC28_008372 [Mycoblastus sanguinarius]|nr:hypothetical protein [Mycoblastus sanguinarius]